MDWLRIWFSRCLATFRRRKLEYKFNDFIQASHSAEAYAGAGFSVSMISATGRYLMGFEPRQQRIAV